MSLETVEKNLIGPRASIGGKDNFAQPFTRSRTPASRRNASPFFASRLVAALSAPVGTINGGGNMGGGGGANDDGKTPPNFRPGYDTAIAMLRELEDYDGEDLPCCFYPGVVEPDGSFATFRTKAQRNIVLECLDRLGGDRTALEGFASILSDFISKACKGAEPQLDAYTRLIAIGLHTDLPPDLPPSSEK